MRFHPDVQGKHPFAFGHSVEREFDPGDSALYSIGERVDAPPVARLRG
jgi:hypothetical protein